MTSARLILLFALCSSTTCVFGDSALHHVQSVHDLQEGDPRCVVGEPCPLDKAIDEFRARGASVCMTTNQKFGGLSNTVGLINRAYSFAVEQDVQFILPPVLPRDHDVGASFQHLFGDALANHAICTKADAVKHFHVKCDERKSRKTGTFIGRLSKGKCAMAEQVITFAEPVVDSSESCACQNVLILSHFRLQSNYNFALTHRDFAKRYWASHPAQMRFPNTKIMSPSVSRGPITIAVHLRLGAELNKAGVQFLRAITEKKTRIGWYVAMLKGILQRVSVDCVRVFLLADETADSDMVSLSTTVEKLTGRTPEVYGSDVAAADAFEVMTHADILLAGGSGFSRLAATLRSTLDAPFPAISFCVEKQSNFKTVLGATVVKYHDTKEKQEATVLHALDLNRLFLQSMNARCHR